MKYAIREIHHTTRTTPDWLARVRSVCESPFAEEKGKAIYAAGFGAWGLWVSNTGWIYRGEFQSEVKPGKRNSHSCLLSPSSRKRWHRQPPPTPVSSDSTRTVLTAVQNCGAGRPNSFGLYDMHGNVAEWTVGRYGEAADRRTARGGSWRDLPPHASASERFGYRPYQKAFDVGFRVVCEDDHLAKDPSIASRRDR